MLKKSENNWDFLRHRLVEAKVRDAFGTYKFYVNGSCLRVLRMLGQGGSAQVRVQGKVPIGFFAVPLSPALDMEFCYEWN